MIFIKKINLLNYRQYKNIEINFEDKHEDSQNNLFVIKAMNGTGKTTLLNSILWCLYGKEYYIQDKDKALQILNSSVLDDSFAGDSKNVEVILTVIDKETEKILEFKRVQTFNIKNNPLENKKVGISNNFDFSINISESGINTKYIQDEEVTSSIVKQYFDEAIYGFYFFDGENLKNYFTKEKAKNIKDSIYNLSQVTLLHNTINRCESLQSEKSRLSQKLIGFDESKIEDVYVLKNNIANEKNRIKTNKIKIERCNKVLTRVNEQLENYEPIKLNIEQRKTLESELDNIVTDMKNHRNEFYSFIYSSLIGITFFPSVNTTYEMITNKEQSGSLPPNIDKNQLKKIIEEHLLNCPICNREIDKKSMMFIKEIYERIDITSSSSHYLMGIKSELKRSLDKSRCYPEKKAQFMSVENELKTIITKKTCQLEEINAFLANYSTDVNEIDIPKLQNERTYYTKELLDASSEIGQANEKISSYENRLILLEKELILLEEKEEKKSRFIKQVRVLRSIIIEYEKIKENLVSEVKCDIENYTWEHFDKMLWKDKTFNKLIITDDYELSVKDSSDREIRGSLSATELMALAYAFTLSIHEASGKNCPLVVDSPLGRVSDKNREKMAFDLLESSRKKQIILLFTPDEYSDEVRNVFEKNKCVIQTLKLTEDEKEILKAGVENGR